MSLQHLQLLPVQIVAVVNQVLLLLAGVGVLLLDHLYELLLLMLLLQIDWLLHLLNLLELIGGLLLVYLRLEVLLILHDRVLELLLLIRSQV